MRAAAASLVALVLTMAGGAAAAADAAPAGTDEETPDGKPAAPPPAKPAREFPRLKRPSLSHEMQFGVAVLPGTGYRVLVPYQEHVACDINDINKRVCTSRVPVFLDAQISYGIARAWDAIVDLRFGLEKDFGLVHQFATAPGFRYWVDPQLDAKFFATIQGVIDTTGQSQGAKVDFGVRNANGFMFEVMRNFGIYLQFGETLGLRRWLRFEVDGGVGVQARFP
jgi:hypothetical protein